jgi:Uma2 family endonuclease
MAEPLGMPIRPLRRVEYDKLVELGVFEGERIELLDGQLVRMNPPKPPHASTVDKLMLLLVRGLSTQARVRVQQPFAANEESEPQPDLAIVPLATYESDHPDLAELIIEVSESSIRYDRGPKLRVYAEAGVPEYWIVNLDQRLIEVHRKPANGRYWQLQSYGESEVIVPERFPEFELRVADVLPAAR